MKNVYKSGRSNQPTVNEISEQVKRAYRAIRRDYWEGTYLLLADALRDTLARSMKAEFKLAHQEVETKDSKPGSRRWTCLAPCNYTDERHNWKFEQWQAAADKELRGRAEMTRNKKSKAAALQPVRSRLGCEYCARLFGPCCNSQEDSVCAECAK